MIALAFCLLLPLQAETGNLLSEGIAAYDAMELDLARTKLAAARKQAPAEERAQVELWIGVVELERGREAAARRALRAALSADPELAVPARLSPKVHALVDELRGPPEPEPAPPRPRPRARAESRPAAAPVVPLPAPAPAPSPPAAVAPVPEQAPSSAPAEPAIAEQASVPSPDAVPASTSATDASPPQGAVEAAGPGVSPFLVLAAGGGAVAAISLASGVALGVSAKALEEEARQADGARDATEAYVQASGNALLANALFVTSAVAASAGVAGAALWAWNGGGE